VDKTWRSYVQSHVAAGVIDAADAHSFLLFLDNLHAQTTDDFKAKLQSQSTHPHYLPAGFTDQTQPIDDGYGALVKLYISRKLDDWLESDDNLEKWEGNRLTAGDRRILMTHWLADAVKMANSKLDTLEKYFMRTGALMTVDGSGDDLFKLEGKPKEETFEFMTFVLDDSDEAEALGEEDDDDDLDPPERDRPEGATAELDSCDDSCDDEDDAIGELPFTLRDAWRISTAEGLDLNATDTVVGRTIMFNWSGVGWCDGVVSRCNTDRRCKLDGAVINYYVSYEMDDGAEAAHVLRMEDLITCNEGIASARHGKWVLIDRG
jgi:hypothetical protein